MFELIRFIHTHTKRGIHFDWMDSRTVKWLDRNAIEIIPTKLSHMKMFIKIPWCHHKYVLQRLWNLTRFNTLNDRLVSFFFFRLCSLQMLALNEILPFKLLKTVTNLFTYLNWPIEKCIRINWKRFNITNSILCDPNRCESNWGEKRVAIVSDLVELCTRQRAIHRHISGIIIDQWATAKREQAAAFFFLC